MKIQADLDDPKWCCHLLYGVEHVAIAHTAGVNLEHCLGGQRTAAEVGIPTEIMFEIWSFHRRS